MTLVQAWIDSIQLLKPKNLQLFVMVTLKSIIEAYKLLFKYFWWLFILQLICAGLVFSISWYFIIPMVIIPDLLFFMVCVITRPSIAKKDCAYFRSQLYYFIYFISLQLIGALVGYLLSYLSNPFSLVITLKSSSEFNLFFPWVVFLVLFFLDAEKNLKNFFVSIWSALKMIIFNFPIVLCIFVFLYIFNSSVVFLFTKLTEGIFQLLIALGLRWRFLINITTLNIIVPLLLLPISICTYANIYIKKLHDQFDLYVSQPQ